MSWTRSQITEACTGGHVKNKPVDIVQECAALFNQEDTLAWFDFQLACGEGCAAPGLCRIGHPKKSTCGKDYVSLVFLIDTPDGEGRKKVIERFKQLGSGSLATMLPEIAAVVSVPSASINPEIYIKQADLILKEKFTATTEFLAQRLYPSIKEAFDLTAGELGWWEDMRKEKPTVTTSEVPEKQAAKSLLVRLKEKLFMS